MSELMKRELEQHREMRPPWRGFDDDPFSMGWRMGPGEDYRFAFGAWWSGRRAEWGEAERIAYLKRWPGRPGWTHQMIGLVWDLNAVDLLPFEEEEGGDGRFGGRTPLGPRRAQPVGMVGAGRSGGLRFSRRVRCGPA